MIKQIQLRGISRTPSDRLTEDGGLSESLNMYIDTAENAPVLIPKDITAELVLPLDLQAERVFVHKTANYENYVAVVGDRIVAFTPDVKGDEEPLLIMYLLSGEKVNDIISIGNTLVISTTANLYYILYRDRNYIFLGNKVPFPYMNLTAKYEDAIQLKLTNGTAEYSNLDGYVPVDEMWKWPDEKSFLDYYKNIWFAGMIPTADQWNILTEVEGEDPKNTFIGAQRLLDDVYTTHQEKCNEQYNEGKLVNPIVVRYAVTLYDSKASSVPIVVGLNDFASKNHIDINCTAEMPNGEYIKVENSATLKYTPYKIFAQFAKDQNLDWTQWKDIIKDVRIYVSQIIPYPTYAPTSTLLNRAYSEELFPEVEGSGAPSGFVTKKISSAKLRLDECDSYKDDLLFATSQTFLVEKVDVFNEEGDITEGFNSLINGIELDLSRFFGEIKKEEGEEGLDNVVQKEKLEVQDRLYNDDMKHYLTLSGKLDSYNNQVILVQPSQLIDYDYNRLNSYELIEDFFTETKVETTYDVTYLLRTHTEDKVIKKQFSYVSKTKCDERIFSFQIFPDSRAFKMLVKATIVTTATDDRTGFPVTTTAYKYGEFDLLPHPYLDCAYYYDGIGTKLINLCEKDSIGDYAVNRVDDLENKLLISEMNDPFSFPNSHRHTFQSKVVGIAVASSALSQGQFGQFPLYVFTEDGIWVMETAADGSFVTSKPLSREVCINPDSIVSIDNAVVFVTSKGVMMISGSQVMNISPYMNGKHYTPNESAKNIIGNQEGFDEFGTAISDETPFTAFMKTAKVAYDYNGQRLIFISSDSNIKFQYIYKIDTQTWHKVSFQELDLKYPLNSYPECHIMGEVEGEEEIIPREDLAEAARLLTMSQSTLESRINNKELIKLSLDSSPVAKLRNLGFIVDDRGEVFYQHINFLISGFNVEMAQLLVNKQPLMQLINCNEEQYNKLLETGNLSTAIDVLPERREWVINSIKSYFQITISYEMEVSFYEFIIEGHSSPLHPIYSRVYNFSTILDVTEQQDAAKGILITRPFDLGMPDVFKSITSIKIRGDYDKGNVKYLLQGSDNGRDFYTLNSLRGKSWKMFRIFILADLEPTERISWIDIDFEPRYNNRLR